MKITKKAHPSLLWQAKAVKVLKQVAKVVWEFSKDYSEEYSFARSFIVGDTILFETETGSKSIKVGVVCSEMSGDGFRPTTLILRSDGSSWLKGLRKCVLGDCYGGSEEHEMRIGWRVPEDLFHGLDFIFKDRYSFQQERVASWATDLESHFGRYKGGSKEDIAAFLLELRGDVILETIVKKAMDVFNLLWLTLPELVKFLKELELAALMNYDEKGGVPYIWALLVAKNFAQYVSLEGLCWLQSSEAVRCEAFSELLDQLYESESRENMLQLLERLKYAMLERLEFVRDWMSEEKKARFNAPDSVILQRDAFEWEETFLKGAIPEERELFERCDSEEDFLKGAIPEERELFERCDSEEDFLKGAIPEERELFERCDSEEDHAVTSEEEAVGESNSNSIAEEDKAVPNEQPDKRNRVGPVAEATATASVPAPVPISKKPPKVPKEPKASRKKSTRRKRASRSTPAAEPQVKKSAQQKSVKGFKLGDAVQLKCDNRRGLIIDCDGGLFEIILEDGERKASVCADQFQKTRKLELSAAFTELWSCTDFPDDVDVISSEEERFNILGKIESKDKDHDYEYKACVLATGLVKIIGSIGFRKDKNKQTRLIQEKDVVRLEGRFWKVLEVKAIEDELMMVTIANSSEKKTVPAFGMDFLVMDDSSLEKIVENLRDYPYKDRLCYLNDLYDFKMERIAQVISERRQVEIFNNQDSNDQMEVTLTKAIDGMKNGDPTCLNNLSYKHYNWSRSLVMIRIYFLAQACSSETKFKAEYAQLAEAYRAPLLNGVHAWSKRNFAKLIVLQPLLGLLAAKEQEEYQDFLYLAVHLVGFTGTEWEEEEEEGAESMYVEETAQSTLGNSPLEVEALGLWNSDSNSSSAISSGACGMEMDDLSAGVDQEGENQNLAFSNNKNENPRKRFNDDCDNYDDAVTAVKSIRFEN
jgi:hypothetical protein